MKKKLLCLLSLFAPLWANAVEVNGLYFSIEDGEASMLNVAGGYSGDIVIPDSVEEDGVMYPVTALADGCFSYSPLSSLVIPNTVKTLGLSCFSHCSIEKLEIPNSVTTIIGQCFRGSHLKSITIPSSVTDMDTECFYECDSLRSVKLQCPVVGDYSFYGCKNLESVEIANTVTVLGNGIFMRCESLKSVDIPNSVVSLGERVFSGCISLETVVLPESLDSLKEGLFYDCKVLKSVSIPATAVYMGDYCFNDCGNLQTLEIPSSVAFIGNGCFRWCSGIKNIVLPTSLQSLGDYAFSNCRSLESVVFPSTLTSIDGTVCFVGNEGSVKTLICEALTPPDIKNDAFKEFASSSIKLYVPDESVEAYKSAEGWKEFDIYSISSSVPVIQIEVDAQNSVIYDLQGRPVTNPRTGKVYIKNGRQVMYR